MFNVAKHMRTRCYSFVRYEATYMKIQMYIFTIRRQPAENCRACNYGLVKWLPLLQNVHSAHQKVRFLQRQTSRDNRKSTYKFISIDDETLKANKIYRLCISLNCVRVLKCNLWLNNTTSKGEQPKMHYSN